MNPKTSFLLDVLRVASAVGVVLVHVAPTRFWPEFFVPPALGHAFVVIFFVLSGFIIASTIPKTRSGTDYVALRLSRLLSCLWPCLAITGALLVAGLTLNPGFHQEFQRDHAPLRFLFSAFFLNEVWWLSAAPPTNSPLWSLSYEFWYYLLFGAWIFVPGKKLAAAACVLIGLIAGPKILVLFPVWLLGVAAYALVNRVKINATVAARGLVLCAVAWAGWLLFHPSWPEKVGYAPWFFSAAWISDHVFGILTAALIFFFNGASRDWLVSERIHDVVRSVASVTFTLYLLHYPCLVFAASLLPSDAGTITRATLLCVIFGAVGAVGWFIEPTRRQVKSGLLALHSRLRAGIAPAAKPIG